jgi:predicted RNase H-like HicB family nuclease
LVEKMRTYTARCQRVGDWWAISVPELKGVNTQARRLEKADAMVRDAIALFLNISADSFEVKIEPVLSRDLQKKVGRARKVRSEAEAPHSRQDHRSPEFSLGFLTVRRRTLSSWRRRRSSTSRSLSPSNLNTRRPRTKRKQS